VYALPAAIVVLSDRPRGIALAVGVLPAAIVGVAPMRRGRVGVVVAGVLTGVPMLVGGLLAGTPVLAVAVIALLGVASAWLAGRTRLGMLVMTLCLPMVGAGLSYPDAGDAAAVAGLIVLGSVWAFLISLAWPERPGTAPPRGRSAAPGIAYGLRLGAAGATAATIGFLLDLEHVGWACAAALLVMRPAADMQRLRSAGRILAVAVGAFAGVGLARAGAPAIVYSVAAVATVAAAAATHRSRWYVTSAFTTFLVFLLLLDARPEDAGSRFDERLLETLLGVALAYLFGLALPALARRVRRRARAAA
jgi:hypothetical protein